MNATGSQFARVGIRIATVVMAALATYVLWPSDVARVEKRTGKLLAALTKSGHESLPVAAAKSLEVASYVATNAVIEIGEPLPLKLHRQEIAPMLQQIRMRADRLEVKSLGRRSERHDDGSIWTDITLEADINASGIRDKVIGDYRLIWEKCGEDWLIIRAEAVDIIEHPAGTGYAL